MLIQYVSDVHTEFHADKGREWARALEQRADVLVLAGDIGTTKNLYDVLAVLVRRFRHVVHVNGNHEYYGADRGYVNRMHRKLSVRYPNYHHLNNREVTVEGQRFVGSTLWWPGEPFEMRYFLNDYNCIVGYSKWIAKAHKDAVDYLSRTTLDDAVVVTHHVPSFQLRPDTCEPNHMDVAYYNNLDRLLPNVKLWVHGHTHERYEVKLHGTKVVTFACGYSKTGRADWSGLVDIG